MIPTTYQTVMLIDDNEIDNFLNQKIIKMCQFADKIDIYTSANEAIKTLENAYSNEVKGQGGLPSIIFLDLNMPLMNGFEFLEKFEALPENIKNQCKIAILTSSINPNDEFEANDHSSVFKYLNKPLGKEMLNKMVIEN